MFQDEATVTRNGSVSSDPNGQTLSFIWTQTARTPVNLVEDKTVTPTFVAPNTTGVLTFQLIVNDGVIDSAPDTVNVTVTDTGTNLPPVAEAGPTKKRPASVLSYISGLQSRRTDQGIYCPCFDSQESCEAASDRS